MSTFEIKVLDHGYVKFIESWGKGEVGGSEKSQGTRTYDDFECGIIEAARQSTQGSFRGWDKDEGLLRYMFKNKHDSSFEFAGMVIEIQAPIFVFREWHRHRTQCLAGDTQLWFNRPCDGKPYYMRIKDVAGKWFAPKAKRRRFDQSPKSLAEFNRDRLSHMSLRMHNGDSIPGLTHINDVMISGDKPLYKLIVGGKSILASADHLFETPTGWLPLSDLSNKEVLMSTHAGVQIQQMFPDFSDSELSNEKWREFEDGYEVSSLGRVKTWWGQGARSKKRIPLLKVITVNSAGRAVVSTKEKGSIQVSRLIWEVFNSRIPDDLQVLHKDDNSLDNRLQNLYLGTTQDNASDRIRNGSQQRLRILPFKVTGIVASGHDTTFDISVESERHNFIANGFVTHNSYNEMSARYAPLPDLNYIPSVERCFLTQEKNKQAQGLKDTYLTPIEVAEWRDAIESHYKNAEELYQLGLGVGIPKELARIILPVGRYSRMRASANLRNWLSFLTLRMHPDAQWEIRQFANAIGEIIKVVFPRTWNLFSDGKSS